MIIDFAVATEMNVDCFEKIKKFKKFEMFLSNLWLFYVGRNHENGTLRPSLMSNKKNEKAILCTDTKNHQFSQMCIRIHLNGV